MKVKLHDLYSVDTISRDKSWAKVLEACENLIKDLEPDEYLEVDFSGINIVDPWEFTSFSKMLTNERICMKFINSESLVHNIKILCIMDGTDPDRIINETANIPKEKTAEEKKIEKYGKELIKYFKPIADSCVYKFDVKEKYGQMHSVNTVNYIEYVVKELNSTCNAAEFIIDIGTVSVLNNVLEALANLIVRYEAKGIKIQVNIDTEETSKLMQLFMHKAVNDIYDNKERFKVIKQSLKPNTAGMLIKYKKTKAVDEFGRHGHGEIISSRIAIFRGLEVDRDNKTVGVGIDVFDGNAFYPKQHIIAEDDEVELPDRLKCEHLSIGLSQIGICDFFLGSDYHFIIQQSVSESKNIIIDLDDNGKNIKKLCTIPERMKLVFADWDIEYDKEELEQAIELTNHKLGLDKQ